MTMLSNIPPQYHEGFQHLYSIDDSFFDSLKDGLLLVGPSSSLLKTANSISKVKSIEGEKTESILQSVGSLFFLLEKGISIDDLAEDVTVVAEQENLFINEVSGLMSRFTKRLKSLLNTEQLFYAAKADDLVEEYHNVFIQARLVTDIRPIFSLKPEEPPAAGIIVHNMHIHYKSDKEGSHKDIFISLDTNDVKTLKEILERAEKKEQALQPIFKNANMKNLSE